MAVFSSRLHWDLRPNSLTELLRRKRARGAAVLDLTESNPTQAGLLYPAEEILGALADPRALLYEPRPAGLDAARETVARGYYAPRGKKVDPSRILLTASTSEAYAYLLKLLTETGDEFLVPRPSYPLFEFLASLESVRVTQYPLIYDQGWSIDVDAMARLITPRTRAIAVVNPNNPTGSFVKRRELERIAALCREHELAILSDEVFSDYAFAYDPARVESLVDVEEVLTFSMSGLSKVAGLPQMKLGWIVASGPERERAAAMERLELIADTYLSVATPVQHGFPRLLAAGVDVRTQILERTRRNLAVLIESTTDSVNRTLAAEGGWYATVRTPRVRLRKSGLSNYWSAAMFSCNLVTSMIFEQDGLLVFSLLTAPDIFAEGLRRFSTYVEQASG